MWFWRYVWRKSTESAYWKKKKNRKKKNHVFVISMIFQRELIAWNAHKWLKDSSKFPLKINYHQFYVCSMMLSFIYNRGIQWLYCQVLQTILDSNTQLIFENIIYARVPLIPEGKWSRNERLTVHLLHAFFALTECDAFNFRRAHVR